MLNYDEEIRRNLSVTVTDNREKYRYEGCCKKTYGNLLILPQYKLNNSEDKHPVSLNVQTNVLQMTTDEIIALGMKNTLIADYRICELSKVVNARIGIEHFEPSPFLLVKGENIATALLMPSELKKISHKIEEDTFYLVCLSPHELLVVSMSDVDDVQDFEKILRLITEDDEVIIYDIYGFDGERLYAVKTNTLEEIVPPQVLKRMNNGGRK